MSKEIFLLIGLIAFIASMTVYLAGFHFPGFILLLATGLYVHFAKPSK